MSDPVLSVAVVVGPVRSRATRVVAELASQDVADRLEVVLVDVEHGRDPIVAPAPLRVVRVPLAGALMSQARGEAVRAASAPTIAFLEEHCYPRPGWARAVVEAHRGPWAAVGFAFENANPESWVSRSALITDYGVFVDPPAGEADFVSGNNVSYRRDALLAFGRDLDRLLVADFNIQSLLRARGERLFVEPRALVAHENCSRLVDVGRANRAFCRVLAAQRAVGWRLRRRLFYALTAPLVAPAVKFMRLVRRTAGRPAFAANVAAALPLILLAYGWEVAGESRGYFDRDTNVAEREFIHHELSAVRAYTRST
jgi:hypothetical protein